MNYGWVGTMIMNKFPKKGVPSSEKGGWVDPTWDKVLNFTVFLELFYDESYQDPFPRK